ncbi:MAG: filamentous hemagglutinin [Xenococcus sp. MO_188.B8]|nr:filamentous hemagglutinin [Xenococcus sp. MO_188.B8]
MTINAPIGLNFRDNPAEIVNGATDVGLEVNPRETLALIGGNIDSEGGQIIAPGANVWLGGLSASGTVSITGSFDLSIPDGIARADLSFSDGAGVDTASDNGGGITVIGNSITLIEASQLFGGIAADSGFEGAQAADINVDATGAVNLSGDSGIRNRVNSGATGNSGDINVTAQSLSLTEGSSFSTSTFGQGNAGAVNITATDSVTFDGEDSDGFNSGAFSTVGTDAIGNSGGITITTGSLSLINGGTVSASTFGQGNAGSVKITATDTIIIDGETSDAFRNSGVFSQVTSTAEGNGGDINITTRSLTLTNGGLVNADTSGLGNAGSVNIAAKDTIIIDGETSDGFPNSGVFSQVTSAAVGNGGDINITTGSLYVTNGGLIDADTRGQGNAGSINITATDTITFDGEDLIGIPAQATSNVFIPEAIGNGGNINIVTGSLILKNGGNVGASTRGQGDAGSVNITANETITIDGETDSSVFSNVSFLFGGNIVANTFSEGNAGDVTITTGSLTLTNGGIVGASTSDEGNAGSLKITASDTISIDGKNSAGFISGVTSVVDTDAVGNAGGITITTSNLNLTNGGQVSASTFGRGNAGSVDIDVREKINLANGQISTGANPGAEGDGGSIKFVINDLLKLSDDSLISAQSSGLSDSAQGNITIDIKDGFVVAFPSEPNGSDIVAFSQSSQSLGTGGNLTITAQGILGLTERPAIPENGTNDIDVSGEFNLIQLTNDINRTETAESPGNLIKSEQSLAQACQRTRTADKPSGLTVKGKGGVPPLPTKPFMADLLIPDGKPITLDKKTDLTSLLEVEENETEPENPNYIPEYIKPIKTSRGDIYPARGIIKTEDGRVILTTYPTNNINTRTPHIAANCNLVKDEQQ